MDGLTTDKEKQEMITLRAEKTSRCYSTPGKDYASVCAPVVEGLFKIPKEVEDILFCLREKPTRDSYKCVWNGESLRITLTSGRTVIYTTTIAFDWYFSDHFPQLLNKPFYVSVYY